MESIPAYMVEKFFDFCTERHSIYLKRFVHEDPWPWTDDKVLLEKKFTNVFRELDTGTIYLREFIREPYAEHPELFFNTCLYRLHNRVETQQFLGHFVPWYDADKTVEKVRQYRDVGNKVFTGAYMITSQIAKGHDKVYGIFGKAAGYIWDHRMELEPQPGDTLEMAFNRLNGKAPGFGPFNAYEVVTDLRWTRYLENATDILEWANAGPGAKRGVARLTRDNLPDVKGFKQDEFLYAMRYLLSVQGIHLPVWFPMMEMRDIEHSLCEFDKYQRVLNGEGKTRGRFIPPHLR